MSTPPTLQRLVEELQRLPGIGRRSAERLADHLLRVPEANALALADAIREARTRIRQCSMCRSPSEADPCPLCRDASRNHAVLMVVETARDMSAMEESGRYRGLYYVLGGRLSPLDGVAGEDLAVRRIADRIRNGGVREVCLATNPDLEGDGTALLVRHVLARLDVRVTQLARGLPTGGQIEYQSAAVLAEAFEARRSIEDPVSEDGDLEDRALEDRDLKDSIPERGGPERGGPERGGPERGGPERGGPEDRAGGDPGDATKA